MAPQEVRKDRPLQTLPESQLAYNPSEFPDSPPESSMTPFLRKLFGQNWLLLVAMLALAIFGVVAIYSATSTRTDSYATDFWRKNLSTWKSHCRWPPLQR